MLHAFVSRGLELRLQEIKYHAQGKDNEIESLTGISSKNSDAEARHKYMLCSRQQEATAGCKSECMHVEGCKVADEAVLGCDRFITQLH